MPIPAAQTGERVQLAALAPQPVMDVSSNFHVAPLLATTGRSGDTLRGLSLGLTF